MTNAHQGTVDIPYQYVNRVEGMNASIEPEGCDTEVYGVAHGTITAILHTPRQTAESSVFSQHR